MRTARRTIGGCALLVLLLASLAVAGDLPVTLVRVTSPAAPFTDATLEAKARPGADCTITVLYKSGPSRARGLAPRQADGAGRVSWTWRVGSNTTPGQWPIEVTCRKGGETGTLRTSFEVR